MADVYLCEWMAMVSINAALQLFGYTNMPHHTTCKQNVVYTKTHKKIKVKIFKCSELPNQQHEALNNSGKTPIMI